ncbi:uncharacterized protein LOC131425033 isoform X2 [Marmota monax]|uniref:uncharacterized protein LOC131425033 isoform X2 n=1 Tax=Marmota monax TaxID=9995 RepID=UPI0026E9DEB6|nr:uncharacterized protein LOC131425033 isoform X2 [Marmota monax]
MRMAVGSVKIQPPCENLALAAAVAAADSALRRSPSAREPEHEQPPGSLRPRLKDLPALLQSRLTLWRKRSRRGPGPDGAGVGSRTPDKKSPDKYI